jgi:hypothetical protein
MGLCVDGGPWAMAGCINLSDAVHTALLNALGACMTLNKLYCRKQLYIPKSHHVTTQYGGKSLRDKNSSSKTTEKTRMKRPEIRKAGIFNSISPMEVSPLCKPDTKQIGKCKTGCVGLVFFLGNPEYIVQGQLLVGQMQRQINSGMDQARRTQTIDVITNIHISIPISKANAHINTRHKRYYDDTPAKRSGNANRRNSGITTIVVLGSGDTAMPVTACP